MLKVAATGRADAATIDGIKAVQETMREKYAGTIIDGRVDPAQGYRYGGAVWTIVSLNRSLRSHFPEIWPRLHDFPDCPGSLKQKIAAML